MCGNPVPPACVPTCVEERIYGNKKEERNKEEFR